MGSKPRSCSVTLNNGTDLGKWHMALPMPWLARGFIYMALPMLWLARGLIYFFISRMDYCSIAIFENHQGLDHAK